MTADRKHLSVAVWATAALIAVLAGYPLSFGPACWLVSRKNDPALPAVYLPIGWALFHFPQPVERAIRSYGRFGMPIRSYVKVPISEQDYTDCDNCLLFADD